MGNIGSKKVINDVSITHNDLESVNSYIKQRQTAILVIMFTDIVGYTKLTEDQGEKYVATLIDNHNEILTNTIEENSYGKVIKYIGDSVMAIFSEPTKAVEVSQLIHNRLDKFNKSFPELEDLKIRIGLHMGQVAIDNTIQGDIFGRHVNRASRIESLAGPRQTYISYPVFDSAKGWLQDNTSLGWKYHGEYFLKGIVKPAEIYQVFDSEMEEPKAPKKGKKKRVVPSIFILLIFVIIGAGLAFGILNYQKTEVFLFDFDIEDVILDNEELFVDGNEGDHKRLLLNELKKGFHILYYDVSQYLRYYSPLEVERGTNLISPSFEMSRTPYFMFKTTLEEGLIFEESKEVIFTYYDEERNPVSETVKCNIIINKEVSGDKIKYVSNWELFKDGIPYKSGSTESEQDKTSRDTNRGEWIEYPKDNVYFLRSQANSRMEYYEIEVIFAWY